MAVAIFRSLESESLEDFSIRLAEKWKIGSKKESDGVLLTVFLDDHKLRIEVGYGLEDKLTDAMSARIIRDVITPHFRAGDIAGGLTAGLASIHQVLVGQELPEPNRVTPHRETGGGFGWIKIIFYLVIILVVLFSRWRGIWLGGGGFNGGGGGWGGGGGGGFSGGGGSFGGGGASGSW